MIQMKQHTSYDDPPDKPFFRHSKRLKDKSSGSEGTMSPAKWINLRTECINQLDKWHMLLEKGAITSEQYQQLQDTILGDIKMFWALASCFVITCICILWQVVLWPYIYTPFASETSVYVSTSYYIITLSISTICDPWISILSRYIVKCSFNYCHNIRSL